MHCITTLALATLAAIGVSALPLGGRGLVTADVILSSRAAEGSVVPDSVHVSSPAGKYVKRVAQESDAIVDPSAVALPLEAGGGRALACNIINGVNPCQGKD